VPTGEAPWSATEMWRRECSQGEEVLKCYFAPDDTKIATCTASQHKVGELSCVILLVYRE